MRPLRLEMQGFSAFREHTTVDFTDVDLVAFVGPTGSGKSSIIDAITFALYGNVARLDARAVAPVIHQLSPEASVRLDFEVGGIEYTAVRIVKRTKAGATTKEARLEQGDDILAGREREMADAVVRVVGLDFGQFTKTVVLPQGQFASFLHERAANRQALLRQLLDLGLYAQMGAIARAHAARSKTATEVLTDQLAKKAETTPEELAELERRAGELESLGAVVGAQLSEIATLTQDATTLRAEFHRLEALRDTLGAIAVPDDLADHAERRITADAALAEATGAAEATRKAATEAQDALDGAPDRLVTVQARTALDRAAAIVEERAALAGQLDGLSRDHSLASSELVEAAAALETANAQHDVAKLRVGNQALVASLVVGEACPICEQLVAEIPAHDIDAELFAAVEAQRNAAARHLSLDQRVREAERTLQGVQAQIELIDAEAARLSSNLIAGATVQSLDAQLAEIDRLTAVVKSARALADQADQAERGAGGVVKALQQEEGAFRRAYDAARDSVAAAEPPAAGQESIHTDWEALVAWASERARTTGVEVETRAGALRDLDARLASLRAALTEAAVPFGFDPDEGDLASLIAVAASEAAAAVSTAKTANEERAGLAAEIATLTEEQQVADQLGRLLRANHFEQWLMASALADVVQRASVRLLELSGGQYTIEAEDGDLWIRDRRNADERRDVRTLSGGETFMASLALALALADSVAELAVEGAPKLESMFIDEGFGTLDPETLEVVASAIDELGAGGRLIGIVTHIRDLADRMPTRFVVSKDATTARVTLVEE